MEKRNKRILWLLNHTTLRECEVPLLIDLGFEVFTPKKFKRDIVNRSGSIEMAYDSSLTIPVKLLKQMNNVDFYVDNWNGYLKHEINKYFDIVICGFFPHLVDEVMEHFRGKVFLRGFGMASGFSYCEWFNLYSNEKTINRVQKGNNVWFAQSYERIADFEHQWLREISLTLSLGLPKSMYNARDSWVGNENRILFVCPNINDVDYYKRIYLEFKENFGDIAHLIVGYQAVPVNDPNVAGFLSQEKYEKMMQSCKLMFYSSREHAHLHYHPLEAVLHGMPLIFMSGGLLDFFAGEKIPGCCETIEEAQEKISRILNNDQKYIEAVIESQKVLLNAFDPGYIKKEWENKFIPIVENSQVKKEYSTFYNKKFTLGVWLQPTIPEEIGSQGILRLLALILLEYQKNREIGIKIACLPWMKNAVVDYMEKLGIATRRIEFLSVGDNSPLLYRLINLFVRWGDPKKPGRLTSLLKKIKQRMLKVRNLAVSSLKNIKEPFKIIFGHILSTRSIIMVLAMLLLGLVAFPVAVICFLAIKGYKVVITKVKLLWVESQNVRTTFSRESRIRNNMRRIFEALSNAEFRNLLKVANSDKNIDCWFFPYPRNLLIDKFFRPVVVAIPDIVYSDFPIAFNASNFLMVNDHESLVQTIKSASESISYSEYVREKQIVAKGYLPECSTHVIRHAPIDTKNLISNDQSVSNFEILHISQKILQQYVNNYLDNDYIRSLPFGDFDYLFVSSQSRASKNYPNLFKAYEKLVREKYCQAKLIITGTLTSEMQKYIEEKNLCFDILSITNLPPKVHAAFYACAKLVVVPTLFEGGFPFVFSEALSVNTPVVMSDIPVVREVLPCEFRKDICFDPYDVNDMTDRIVWALSNHDALMNLEVIAYKQMKKRTWKHVAEEYMWTFMSARKRVNS